MYIKPASIEGCISAPSSKSVMQRLLAVSSLCDDETEIRFNSSCDDTDTAIQIIKDLGCELIHDHNKITVRPKVKKHEISINCNESGLCMRMFSPLVALYDNTYSLHAKGTLLNRPVGFMEKPLRDLGAEISTERGYPPVMITGPIQGGKTTVDGSITSQFITGLLTALPVAEKNSEIELINPKSKPYIYLTLSILKDFGIDIGYNNDLTDFFIKGMQRYKGKNKVIIAEGDWSSASFFLVAGAVAGSVTVDNLELDSRQADRVILEVLQNAGAIVKTCKNTINVERGRLKSFDFDAAESPDLVPPLTALAISCEGISRIYGIERLIHKESNRVLSLYNAFLGLGADMRNKGSHLEILGKKIRGGTADSYGDHRIAMSLAVAGLKSREGIHINGHQAVSKSYPLFFNDFMSILKERQ